MNKWMEENTLDYREDIVTSWWISKGLVSLMTATELPIIENSGMRLHTEPGVLTIAEKIWQLVAITGKHFR